MPSSMPHREHKPHSSPAWQRRRVSELRPRRTQAAASAAQGTRRADPAADPMRPADRGPDRPDGTGRGCAARRSLEPAPRRLPRPTELRDHRDAGRGAGAAARRLRGGARRRRRQRRCRRRPARAMAAHHAGRQHRHARIAFGSGHVTGTRLEHRAGRRSRCRSSTAARAAPTSMPRGPATTSATTAYARDAARRDARRRERAGHAAEHRAPTEARAQTAADDFERSFRATEARYRSGLAQPVRARGRAPQRPGGADHR